MTACNVATIGHLRITISTQPGEVSVLRMTVHNLNGPTLATHIERAALLMGLRGTGWPIEMTGDYSGAIKFLYLPAEDDFPYPVVASAQNELTPVSPMLALLADEAMALQAVPA